MVLIRCDLDEWTATRFETGGEHVRKTHFYRHDRPVSAFCWDWLQFFRLTPPDEFKIEPGPRPTNPPAGAGTIQRAA